MRTDRRRSSRVGRRDAARSRAVRRRRTPIDRQPGPVQERALEAARTGPGAVLCAVEDLADLRKERQRAAAAEPAERRDLQPRPRRTPPAPLTSSATVRSPLGGAADSAIVLAPVGPASPARRPCRRGARRPWPGPRTCSPPRPAAPQRADVGAVTAASGGRCRAATKTRTRARNRPKTPGARGRRPERPTRSAGSRGSGSPGAHTTPSGGGHAEREQRRGARPARRRPGPSTGRPPHADEPLPAAVEDVDSIPSRRTPPSRPCGHPDATAGRLDEGPRRPHRGRADEHLGTRDRLPSATTASSPTPARQRERVLARPELDRAPAPRPDATRQTPCPSRRARSRRPGTRSAPRPREPCPAGSAARVEQHLPRRCARRSRWILRSRQAASRVPSAAAAAA